MKELMTILQQCTLFDQVDEKELLALLQCLSATPKTYSKNSFIMLEGDNVSCVGIILKGKVQIIQEDTLGNRTIVTELEPGQLFGETFACAHLQKSPVTVLTATGCEVLLIQLQKIITSCSSSCVFHTQLISNLLKVIAQKNISLNQKINLLSYRTTREKILAYLTHQSHATGQPQFQLPYSREELADFLCVNRSALSRELSKLQQEGFLTFEKNQFTLLFPLHR